MCYAKPGPRCAGHVGVELEEAKKAYENNPTSPNFEKLYKIQKDYDSTPGGRKELIKQIKDISPKAGDLSTNGSAGFFQKGLTNEDREQILLLQKRILDGKELREKRMQDYLDVQAVENSQMMGIKAPVITGKNPMSEPSDRHRISQAMTYSLEYEENTSDSDDYYDKDDYYPEPKMVISHIDVPSVLSAVFDCSPAHINSDLKAYAKKLGLDKEESYDYGASIGYYNESVINAELKEEKMSALRQWYYQQNNAEDKHGILLYVRSKGTETANNSPLDAIKKQLAEEDENKGARVSQAAKISVNSVSLRGIARNNNFEGVEPKESATYLGSRRFDGILLSTKKGYVLIDGYQRVKSLMRKTATGNFIILHEN